MVDKAKDVKLTSFKRWESYVDPICIFYLNFFNVHSTFNQRNFVHVSPCLVLCPFLIASLFPAFTILSLPCLYIAVFPWFPPCFEPFQLL